MKKLLYLIVLMVAFGLIVSGCIPVVPPTEQNEPELLPNKSPDLYVGPSGYSTIQAAINDASPGDTIIVAAGTYNEYLLINKDGLTIQGAGIDQSIIDLEGLIPYWHYGTNTSYASRGGVLITPYGQTAAGGNISGGDTELIEDVTFEGFTVKNAGLNPPNTSYTEFYDPENDGQDNVAGIQIGSGKDIIVENCKIDNSGTKGIRYGTARRTDAGTRPPSENPTIINCTVQNNTGTGLLITAKGTATITDNTILNNLHLDDLTLGRHTKGTKIEGVSESDMLGGTIAYNTVSGNRYHGITVSDFTDGFTVEDNTVTGHNLHYDGAGIFLSMMKGYNDEWGHPEYCKNHIVRNNTVTGNIRGIIAYFAQGCTIEDNTITIDSGNFNPGQEGIKIDGSNNMIVRNNDIEGNDGTGIKVQNAWTGTESYDNNITGNTITNMGFPGIKVSSNARNNTFTDNTITGAYFAGIFIYLGAYDNTFTCNTITGTVIKTLYIGQPYEETQGDGVFLWGYPGLEAGTGNAFHYNNIYGNAYDGMENQTTTEVNAECNWWGSHDGPNGEGSGAGDAVSTYVDFEPWIGITELSGPTEPVQLGNPVNIDLSFTCNEGTATLEWGDETPVISYLSESETTTESHTYSEAGVYTVTLTIENSCGSDYSREFHYVVVYDPAGGFVTGGGWIDSPAGAYTPEPDLFGKATFGFVSKYKKGATVPTGKTEFQFKAGDLNFHSESYDWLVIAGAKAMYKGTGTINGMGEYKFMLSAIDADINENNSLGVDCFRIKIWGSTGDIYDNQMNADENADPTTAIGGGQIVIHKRK